jgi:hypothetical protein
MYVCQNSTRIQHLADIRDVEFVYYFDIHVKYILYKYYMYLYIYINEGSVWREGVVRAKKYQRKKKKGLGFVLAAFCWCVANVLLRCC